MRIAGIEPESIVDGPGIRFTVFTQGCPLQCPGCHNPATWDPCGGQEVDVEEVIAAMNSSVLASGLTLSGERRAVNLVHVQGWPAPLMRWGGTCGHGPGTPSRR